MISAEPSVGIASPQGVVPAYLFLGRHCWWLSHVKRRTDAAGWYAGLPERVDILFAGKSVRVRLTAFGGGRNLDSPAFNPACVSIPT